MQRAAPLLMLVLPGLLVAATGVGAGDLATAAIAGSKFGVSVAWAVLLGAAMKYIVTEGLARWQIATGTTLLEGMSAKFGWIAGAIFLVYLVPWSFFVGSALISACSAASRAMLPSDPFGAGGRVVWGGLHSLAGLGIVLAGGFKWFERIMTVAIGLMFVSVVVAAAALRPDFGELARGLVVPLPASSGVQSEQGAIGWVVALIGGVGGTVTVLCYGYWIREHGRDRPEHMRTARVDLAVGYSATALFGVAMLVIASRVGPATGSGVGLLTEIGAELGEQVGVWARWLFLIGAWAAVFSSLLGVWQAVPYLFADVVRTMRRDTPAEQPLTASRSYRAYLLCLAIVPMLALLMSFTQIQKLYAVVGATFVPMLALVLLVLNGRRGWVGRHRNSVLSVGGLMITLAFFVWVAIK